VSKCLTDAEAVAVIARAARATIATFSTASSARFPRWDIKIQVVPEAGAKFPFNPFT
jgi:catalase